MIKNVIFDFGQVIVHFNPKYMTEKYITGKDARLVEEVVFDRLYWDRLDKGDISDDEVVNECKKRLPEHLWDTAEKVYFNWIYHIPEINGMRDIVKKLKVHGIHVFLLSNISTYFANHKDEIDILKEFEDCVFSAVVGMAKPNRDIFEYICKKNGLNPSETLFVDDNKANIKGAQNAGICTYLFDGNAEKLSKYLSL